jgi:hypothetical protein
MIDTKYPTVATALRILEIDNLGTMAKDLAPKYDAYILLKWIPDLDAIEAALKALSKEDLETLSTGERSEMAKIAERSKDLTLASEFLDDMYEPKDNLYKGEYPWLEVG